jgi:hypothetical protein
MINKSNSCGFNVWKNQIRKSRAKNNIEQRAQDDIPFAFPADEREGEFIRNQTDKELNILSKYQV